MNPQMNKVFSKLAKEDNFTKLASQKVELALLDDLQQQSNDADDLSKRAKALKAEIKNTKNLLNESEKNYSARIKRREQVKKEYEKALANTKSLEGDYKGTREKVSIAVKERDTYAKGLKQEEKDLSKLEKQASTIRKRLSDNIAKAQRAEKDLGVKMPRLKDYVKTLQDLNSSFRN